jgi:hypothetical protein
VLLRDDDTYKVYVQNSINRIETVFGNIKYKYGIGANSVELVGRLNKQAEAKQKESQLVGGSINSRADPEVDGLIMIDRGVDLISPFCI